MQHPGPSWLEGGGPLNSPDRAGRGAVPGGPGAEDGQEPSSSRRPRRRRPAGGRGRPAAGAGARAPGGPPPGSRTNGSTSGRPGGQRVLRHLDSAGAQVRSSFRSATARSAAPGAVRRGLVAAGSSGRPRPAGRRRARSPTPRGTVVRPAAPARTSSSEPLLPGARHACAPWPQWCPSYRQNEPFP